MAHLGLVVPVDSPHTATRAVRPALQFDGVRAGSVTPAPLLNEHGEAIRAALARGKSWPEAAAAHTGAARAQAKTAQGRV